MHLRSANFKPQKRLSASRLAVAAVTLATLAGCNAGKTLNPSETLTQGYVMDDQSLDLVPVGSSREQVLLALGTPSTTSTFENETFYYISQTRKRGAAFMKPKLVDQRILTVFFGPDGRVAQIANYGLKDGRVFDFISATTPTGGKEQTFITSMLSGLGKKPDRLPGT